MSRNTIIINLLLLVLVVVLVLILRVERDIYYSKILKAREKINDDMGYFKRLKFCKRAGNCRTGFVRIVVKCLRPCTTRRSSSPSPENNRSVKENKSLEICKETTNGRTGAQYEALIQPDRHRELIDIHRMTRQEKSPNTPQFDSISSRK
jgi:hypothetical protein